MHSARDSVRYFPIEGAVEAFAPRTGLHVVYRGDETRHLVPLAPRAVLFGLSHACNLGCAFCSRDEAVRSTWDVASATSFLRGLYELGVAEVSFGGGEPLAYRGFFDLIDALYERTALALHVTSNAVLLDDRAIARIEGKISEVRVSVYDDTPWDERIRALVGAGIRVSANVLVEPSNVREVPALLHRLAELGARIVPDLLNLLASRSSGRATRRCSRSWAVPTVSCTRSTTGRSPTPSSRARFR